MHVARRPIGSTSPEVAHQAHNELHTLLSGAHGDGDDRCADGVDNCEGGAG